VLPSAAKLNLVLRVTGRREDGYQDIMSLFLRLPPAETLLISEATGGADAVHALGVETTGENIVSRALRRVREEGFDVPFLDVEILKTLPPGSGLGAGSGNGAAVLRWLAGAENSPAWWKASLRTGADVPFLFSGFPLALVSGVGEVIEPLEPLENLSALVVFPEWSVRTENAYTQLDRWGVHFLRVSAARAEARTLYHRLRNEERVGLLPNDFAPGLIKRFPEYCRLFDVFDQSGYIAWGITGSGGAAFALSAGARGAPFSIQWPAWVSRVFSINLADC
jgi:4-diphosphocytidyl-2-C-methyl-D-erythritol kinase